MANDAFDNAVTDREMLEKTEPRKPRVRMVGEDGNAFAIIGRVSRALTQDGQPERAKEWSAKAMSCGSYDDLLALMFSYVDPT